jgi:TolA-binding protein
MRAFVTCLMVAGIVLSPAIARASGTGDKTAAATSETSASSSGSSTASDQPATASKTEEPAKPKEAGLENELQELRDLIEAQSKQIQAQSEQLREEQQQMQTLENRLKSSGVSAVSATPATPSGTVGAAAPAGPAPVTASAAASTLAASSTSAAIGPTVNAAAAVSANPATPQTQGFDKNPDQPAALRYKGITLAPGGYFAAETVDRNRAIGSGINSAFGNVPLPGQEQSHISEFNAGGRQSRIAMLAQGKLKSVTIGGYYEGDFLSAGITSNDNQSNSYTFRQRQFWGQAKFNNGWTVTGGQMWSLVTETKVGLDNRTEATTQTIDAQYNAGFSWTRQYGLRVVKDFSNKVWLGASIEEAQTTLAAHGQFNNFLVGEFGQGGGLYNATANYAFNAAPDFVVKAAFEPGWGHFEVFGLLTTPRDRVYPCATASATTSCGGVTGASAALAYNDTRNGGGIGANARGRVLKHVDLGLHFFGGDGIGRYGSVGLPQVTVRPNGTLAPIRNYQSLGTIEIFTNKLDVYMNVGDEYSARAWFGTSAANAVGYGSPFFTNKGCWTEPVPGSATSVATGLGGGAGFVPGGLSNCTNDIKHLMESTVGFWYRFYKGPMGTMQFGMQESYFIRYDWNGVGTTSGVGTSGAPHGTDNMVFTSLRYYIP